MSYLPCRECLAMPRPPRLAWRLPLALAVSLLLVGGCGGSGGASQDPRRQKYEADKARCEQTSQEEAARKSCMVYRGWPDGKFR